MKLLKFFSLILSFLLSLLFYFETSSQIIKQQTQTYGLFQFQLPSGWEFDKEVTDNKLITFRHVVDGSPNYNVRIKVQPVSCPSSKDFDVLIKKMFRDLYNQGSYVDKYKEKSDYSALGQANCHMMTYISVKTNQRGFILSPYIQGKMYNIYIFDKVDKKKELRKEVIDFINGISLSNNPQPILAKNQTSDNNKTNEDYDKVSDGEITNDSKSIQNNTKIGTISKSNNSKVASESYTLSVMDEVPPSKPIPFLDITTISKTEWDGAVSAAMEGMRLVYGYLTEGENKEFEKTWAPLRQTPFKEAVDYLNKFNPLLGEFLTYRTAITQTSILLEQAVQNAGYAAEYDDPESSFSFIDLASKYQTLMISRQKRLQQITNELIALGNPPDGAQMMADQQRRYKQEKDYLKSLVNNFDPEGCWAGYMNTLWDKYLGKGDIHSPEYQYFYKVLVDGVDTYYSIRICPNCNLGLTKGNCSYSESDKNIRENYKSENYVGIGQGGANDGKVFRVFNKFEFPNIPEFSETSDERYQLLIDAEKEKYKNTPTKPDVTLFLDYIRKKRFADVFFITALRWTKENKWQQFDHKKENWQAPDELLLAFSNEMASGSEIEFAQSTTKPNNPKKVNQTENEQLTDKSNLGENNLHIIDDKNPEDRRKIDAEAIEFHKNNLAIIQQNMDKDQEELANESDPKRRKDYQMRILGAQANIQSEKDRIASIQTGIIVFNRSPWDDYTKSNFIQNISENQRTMENISRGIRKAYEMADRLPDDEARKARAIINEKYNGEIMANLDENAARDIINEANSVGKKYYQEIIDAAKADKRVADEEAEWAESCLQTAEIVKTTADYSMMGLSMFGGKYVNNAYQGITGYIEGGPKEAFLRVSSSYNTITGIAVDGFRGFEDAVNQGGDVVDGIMGAGWEVTKGLITDKAMSYGAGKISAKFNRPNGDLPNIDGSTRTGQTSANNSTIVKSNSSNGIETDFNRPLTSQEIAVHREQIADGRNKVNSYKKTFEKLEIARKGGAPASEIKKILIELDDRSAKIHSSPQAKMMMKTMQKQPKNLEMIKRYSNSMDRVHQKVEKRYQAEMQSNGWSPEELTPIRNKPDPADLLLARKMQAGGETVKPEALLGSKTVNMDYDAGRKPKIGADGKPIPPMKNGKPVPVEAWHAQAQAAWEKAYYAETGQSPTLSWENITHGKLGDAYADLNVLQKNGILNANKEWAGQTADVSYYKAEHLRGSPEFQRAEKYIEIARGTSKDYSTKMMPLIDQKRPQAGTPSYEAWKKHKSYWDEVNGILEGMGNGRIDPMTADRKIRQISGGKSVLEVTFDMRNFMESLMLLGRNSN